jgi:predicted dehydrogenase
MIRKSLTPSPASRRQFLKQSAAAASLLLLGRAPLGAQSETPTAPSRKLRTALIGIGNRGWDLIRSFDDTGLIEWVAAADVDYMGEHCAQSRERLAGVPLFQDFREMLAKHGDEIEAVLIATPDFSHTPVAIACMAAGKHVFVEKPLAPTFHEIYLLMEQARRTGVVTQMGNQGHSGANYFQFKAWSEAGVIKDITRIDAYMNGVRRWHGWNVDGFADTETAPPTVDWDLWNAGRPLKPYSRKLHPQEWRGWFGLGSGALGDWAAHILDTAHRFLDLGMPSTVEALRREGPSDFIFPQASTLRFSVPARGDKPACEVTWYDGVDNLPPLPAEDDPAVKRQSAGKFIYGGGTVFKGGTHEAPLRIIPAAKMQELGPTLPKIPPKYSNHYANFALACLGLEEARSPFSVSGPLSQFLALGIIAQQIGGRLEFDRKRRLFTNSDAANKLLSPPPARAGWEKYCSLAS